MESMTISNYSILFEQLNSGKGRLENPTKTKREMKGLTLKHIWKPTVDEFLAGNDKISRNFEVKKETCTAISENMDSTKDNEYVEDIKEDIVKSEMKNEDIKVEDNAYVEDSKEDIIKSEMKKEDVKVDENEYVEDIKEDIVKSEIKNEDVIVEDGEYVEDSKEYIVK